MTGAAPASGHSDRAHPHLASHRQPHTTHPCMTIASMCACWCSPREFVENGLTRHVFSLDYPRDMNMLGLPLPIVENNSDTSLSGIPPDSSTSELTDEPAPSQSSVSTFEAGINQNQLLLLQLLILLKKLMNLLEMRV